MHDDVLVKEIRLSHIK